MSGLQDTRLRQPDELVYGLPRAGHHLRGFGADPFGLPVELIVVNVRVLEHLPLAQDHGIEPFDIIGQLRQDPDEVGAGAFKFRHLSSFQAKAGARLSTILNFYGLGPWKLMGVGAPPNARDPNSGSFHLTFRLVSDEVNLVVVEDPSGARPRLKETVMRRSKRAASPSDVDRVLAAGAIYR